MKIISEVAWVRNFRNKLSRIMEEENMTARDLSRLTTIPEGTISRYKNGARIPNGYFISIIANALNCSVDDLIGVDTDDELELAGFGPEERRKLLKLSSKYSVDVHYIAEVAKGYVGLYKYKVLEELIKVASEKKNEKLGGGEKMKNSVKWTKISKCPNEEIDILKVTKCPNNTYNVYINGEEMPINYHLKVLESFDDVKDFISQLVSDDN